MGTQIFDPAVAERQQIGAFAPASRDAADATLLREGTLRLPPHPDFRMPAIDKIDWLADPFQQSNWRFQFNSLRWLDCLRKDAQRSEERREINSRLWLDYAKSWGRSDAFERVPFAQDMADGIRAIVLVLGYPIVRDYGQDWVEAYGDLLWQHLERMATPSSWGRGNHALHQMQGLLVVSSFLNESQAKRVAVNRLSELYNDVFDSQGTCNEASPAYSDANIGWWRTALARLRLEGQPLSHSEEIFIRACNVVAHMTRPDGKLESLGDTRWNARSTQANTSGVKYAQSDGLEGEPPGETAVVLDRGYYFGRSGWGDSAKPLSQQSFLSIRFGNRRQMHGHSDASSVTFHAKAEQWFIDPGMIDYRISPARRYLESAAAHNVVAPKFETRNLPNRISLDRYYLGDGIDLVCLKLRTYPNFTIDRTVFYLKDFDLICVIDRATPNRRFAPFPDFVQNWHLNPKAKVLEVERGKRQITIDSKEYYLLSLPNSCWSIVSGQENPMAGWYSKKWGELEPSPVVQISPGVSSRASDKTQCWLAVMSPFRETVINGLSWEGDVAAVSISVNGNRFTLRSTDNNETRGQHLDEFASMSGLQLPESFVQPCGSSRTEELAFSLLSTVREAKTRIVTHARKRLVDFDRKRRYE